MSQPIIEVRELSKRYQLGAFGARSLRDELEVLWGKARSRLHGGMAALNNPRAAGHNPEFWALTDVSFAVQPGEVLGVIGRNGAGKSTLLKILSRITEPTEGEIVMRGRVASLLEVGTGFHPELSGRDNIFLNGAILGMKKDEIARKFDEIVEFAEVAKFIDTPVKRYSSGMYVRLAFAVAAHLEPEILIVDEVLAVGDQQFQNKCLGKMRDVSRSGRTVLFVSHNLAAVENLCNTGLYLRQGRVASAGPIRDVLRAYRTVSDVQGPSDSAILFNDASEPEPDTFKVHRIELTDSSGNPHHPLHTWDEMILDIRYSSPSAVSNGSAVIEIETESDQKLCQLSTKPLSGTPLSIREGMNRVVLKVPRLPLAAGRYKINFGVAIPWSEYLLWSPGICTLEVFPRDVFSSGVSPEAARTQIVFDHSWITEKS